MERLPLETIAIVRATLPDVAARQAAITLRMWHHLPPGFERDLMFVSHESGHIHHTLVEALVAAVRQADGGKRAGFVPPRLLATMHCAAEMTLQEALLKAIADVIGPRATDMVMHAWRRLLESFFTENCRR